MPAPADEDECRGKFADFLAFVEDARERADATNTSRPSLGFAPYFLSFFWEAEDRDAWPVYYAKSRDVLARHGPFLDSGPLADRYLRYREQLLLLGQELNGDTWGVEELLWHLAQTSMPVPGPRAAAGRPLRELPQRELIFPDEIVTSWC